MKHGHPVVESNDINQNDSPVFRSGYRPSLGFIGQTKVQTSNYLFRSGDEHLETHPHARRLLSSFLKHSPEEHYVKSELLTEFIRKRGLTFSKKLENGESRIFTVPVTSSIVPLAKSTFNELERNAQSLVISLRWILQSIYGSKRPEDSEFVKHLPDSVREIFLRAIRQCPQYFEHLHHPSMRDYPFFEIVGLDLVLIDDYRKKTDELFSSTATKDLPFKLLELNAGSPSGASNNMSVLEGLLEVDPEFARIADRVMPNDHFDVLRATFDSIGREWTGSDEGISVILPPGGANGAAPEIHQLSAYSGMPYIDASMLYVDDEGVLRLRTLSGEDPRVTSIYSRVNADAALYDKERGLLMRDAESGEPLYQEDVLAKAMSDDEDEKHYMKGADGNPIPLDSIYAIPNAIELIQSKKLYLGGLNRILDNKLILATLTHYGPRFYEKRLAELGLSEEHFGLTPPDTLPPEAKSVEIIEQNPDDWVIKAPDLSGGSGVHILLTLPEAKKKKVLEEARKSPTEWAYQKLVKIARIPVARKESGRVRFSNLAADIRMWCFWGAGPTFSKPRLTHNGLVRYAPQEKGPLSSIVNTSKGGGYAPLLVIDDCNTQESCTVLDLTSTKTPPAHTISTPNFIGAQIYQISRQIQRLFNLLEDAATTPSALFSNATELKSQLNEVLSYLSPKNMEPLSAFISILGRRTGEKKLKKIYKEHQRARIRLVEFLIENQSRFSDSFFERARKLHSLQDEYAIRSDARVLEKEDRARIAGLIELEGNSKEVREAAKRMKSLAAVHLNEGPLSEKTRVELRQCLEAFAELALDRLSRSEDRDLAYLFSIQNLKRPDRMDQSYRAILPEFEDARWAPIATLWELQNRRSLLDSPFIQPEVREAFIAWQKAKSQVERLAHKMSATEKNELIERKREEHFKRFPFLAEIQNLVNTPHNHSPDSIRKVLSVLPYAKYNVEQYLRMKNLSFEELFSDTLSHGKVSILSQEKMSEHGLNPYFAGECFAKKRKSHGLFSESDILTWMNAGSSAFIQAYTLGHELIHFHQIEELMKRESRTMKRGSLDLAEFLNFYGNFLANSAPSVEKLDSTAVFRKCVYFGLADIAVHAEESELITKYVESYSKSDEAFERTIRDAGRLLSWMTPVSTSMQVKALREVIPCLENAKNIRFAKELGLSIHLDETKSALPSANARELKRYKKMIEKASFSGGAEPAVLQVIAEHQLFGVRAELEIHAGFHAISLGAAYNSSQQQQ